ncbi:YdeI/OmpD-associated family protein [Micromonospora sp. BQ11]|uniref:YdeI/OmpD-associated family protein n=1 Tax=Micromonospora sp. BQ11 TaxID=3452212 RepID=UPI003F8B7074
MEHRFTGHVEALHWGRNRYHIIRVPDGLADDARREGTRRVSGTIDGAHVNVALNRAPVVDGSFLWAGDSLQRRVGLEPDERVDGVLEPADPDVVDLAEDVRQALVDAGSTERWEALPAPARRRRLYRVDQAKRPDTRARRITELIADLQDQVH